jgi:hypothetical protein
MAPRFPRKIEVWVPDQISDGFTKLAAADPLFTVSDHARLALARYLHAYNIPATSPRANGHHKPDGHPTGP